MNANERPVPRIIHGGDGSSADRRLAALLEPMQPGEPPPGMGDRIWRRIQRGQHRERPTLWRRLRRLWPLPSLAAAAALVLVALQLSSPSKSMAIVLASGDVRVEQPGQGHAIAAVAGAPASSGTRIITGPKSRAVVRGPEYAALLPEETEAVVESGRVPSVALVRGTVAVAARPRKSGRPLSVHARGYLVRVTGTLFSVSTETPDGIAVAVSEGTVEVAGHGSLWRVAEGECWSSATRASQPCSRDPNHATLRALATPAKDEVRLQVDGPPTMHVRAGSIELGRPPIDWLAPAGSQLLVGTDESASVAAKVTLSPGLDKKYVFDDQRAEAALVIGSRWKDAAPAKAGPDHPLGVHLDRPPPTPHAPAARLSTSISGAQPAVPSTRAAASIPAVVAEESSTNADGASPPPVPKETTESEEPAWSQQYAAAKRLVSAGKYPEAERALSQLAASSSPFAEVALYEVGWVRLKYLGDSSGAVRACEEYQERYREGRLLQEVDLNLVQALVTAAERDRALVAADAFLARHPSSEKGREVSLVRANLLCELAQYEAARASYRELERSQDLIADEATWSAAVCLAKAGWTREARAQLERYHSRFPTGLHHDEAEKLLAGP